MKNVLIAGVCVMTMVAGSAMADGHGGKGHGMDRKERMERMREHLDLSDEQVEQMREIRQGEGSREEKREQIRAVLSDEQQAKFDEARAKRRAKHEAAEAAE